jgi:hypothetical protein
MIRKSSAVKLLPATFLLLCFCGPDTAQEEQADQEWQPVFADFPVVAIVDVNIADIRAEQSGRSERISQALFFEIVEILEEGRRYARIRQEDGYEGWIRKSFLVEREGFSGVGPFIVSTNLAPVYESPDRLSGRVTSIPYGSWLFGEESSGFLKIVSDRYGDIFIGLEDLESVDSREGKHPPDSTALCTEAEKFFGAPYLWGGRSFYGVDCSGFTQIILARYGVKLPRDTKDQIKVGTEVKREDIRVGDLIFFPRHVGLAVSRNLMIHSTGSNGGVAYNSLDPDHPQYSEYHDDNYVTARRVMK